MHDSTFCFRHNLKLAIRALEASQTGGANRSMPIAFQEEITLNTTHDLQQFIGRVINGVWQGKVPVKVGTSLGFLKTLYNAEDERNDVSNIKYVVYARKSTESEERQIRSLGDQVAECRKIVSDRELQLYTTDPITESESAKEPDIRPKFRQMLDDIKAGKYGGIIAWHPDRLARNMKDAGEIIDLIDKKIIKDLQFVSFTFQNNAAGKMLLGIAFVLSKQYSDQLSDNVLRGNKRSIEEGKYINKTKHGYYKDVNQYLRPDGDNFLLIKEAWKMRLAGKQLEEIVKYLNDHHYSRPTSVGGNTHERYIIDVKRVSELLRDSIYCGVLLFGEKEKKIVDLTEI